MRTVLRTLILAVLSILPLEVFAQDLATLTYVGRTRDLVSFAGMSPDGTNDAVFKVDISGSAKHILSITLMEPVSDLAWKTALDDRRPLGVSLLADSALANNQLGRIDLTANGVYLYAACIDTVCTPGKEFTVAVATEGATYTAKLVIPAPSGGATPTPTDDDGDGVPNASDKCPGTPTGAAVDLSGCAAPPPIGTTPSGPRVIWPRGEYATGTKAISGVVILTAVDDTTPDLRTLEILLNGYPIAVSTDRVVSSGAWDTRGAACTMPAPCTVQIQARTVVLKPDGSTGVVLSPVVTMKIQN